MRAAGEEDRPAARGYFSSALILGALLLTIAGDTFGQVSPAEIINPQLKAAEAKYFSQLKSLNHAIEAAKFPFPFYLSRYVGLDPAQQAEADSRGIEFVRFHERVVLKITGNYNAAYNAVLLAQNQRATHVFEEVITPILQLVTQEIPADVTCDAIGFEISFHTRSQKTNYDYEGKEILVAVLAPADAFAFSQAQSDQDRQEILNRSEIYLDGNLFGLALYQANPFDLEALGRTTTPTPPETAVNSSRGGSLVGPKVVTDFTSPTTRTEAGGKIASSGPGTPAPPAPPAPVNPAAARRNTERCGSFAVTISAPTRRVREGARVPGSTRWTMRPLRSGYFETRSSCRSRSGTRPVSTGTQPPSTSERRKVSISFLGRSSKTFSKKFPLAGNSMLWISVSSTSSRQTPKPPPKRSSLYSPYKSLANSSIRISPINN